MPVRPSDPQDGRYEQIIRAVLQADRPRSRQPYWGELLPEKRRKEVERATKPRVPEGWKTPEEKAKTPKKKFKPQKPGYSKPTKPVEDVAFRGDVPGEIEMKNKYNELKAWEQQMEEPGIPEEGPPPHQYDPDYSDDDYAPDAPIPDGLQPMDPPRLGTRDEIEKLLDELLKEEQESGNEGGYQFAPPPSDHQWAPPPPEPQAPTQEEMNQYQQMLNEMVGQMISTNPQQGIQQLLLEKLRGTGI